MSRTDWLRAHENGTLLLVYIQPGAAKAGLAGEFGDPPRLKLKVSAPPRDGEANAAVVEFLSVFIGVPKKKIFLIRGESSRNKDLLIELPLNEMQNLFDKIENR